MNSAAATPQKVRLIRKKVAIMPPTAPKDADLIPAFTIVLPTSFKTCSLAGTLGKKKGVYTPVSCGFFPKGDKALALFDGWFQIEYDGYVYLFDQAALTTAYKSRYSLKPSTPKLTDFAIMNIIKQWPTIYDA